MKDTTSDTSLSCSRDCQEQTDRNFFLTTGQRSEFEIKHSCSVGSIVVGSVHIPWFRLEVDQPSDGSNGKQV